MRCHNPGFSLLTENQGRLFWTITRDLLLQSRSCTAQLLYLGGWENLCSHDAYAKTHRWKWYKSYQMELPSVTAADDKGSQKIRLFLCLPHWKRGKEVSEQLVDKSCSFPHPHSSFAPTSPWWLCSAIYKVKRLWEPLAAPQA